MRGWYKSPKTVVSLLSVLVFIIAVACGSSSTEAPDVVPTSGPSASATNTPVPQVDSTEPPPTDSPAMVAPQGTLTAALTEVYPFQSAPVRASGGLGLFLGVTLGEPMVGMNTKNEFTPKIIKEWSFTPDGLIWTFKLQEGIQFHKGYGEMTAEDLIWSVEEGFAHDDSSNAFRNQLRRLWLNEEGWSNVVDDHTLEIHTGTLQYDMLNVLSRPSVFVMSKKQFEEEGLEAASINGAGTGPWEIVEHKSGQFWRFEAMDPHYRKTPNFAEMIWREIPEESTRVANFQTGKIDTFNMQLDSLDVIKKVPDVKFMRVPGGGTIHLGYYGNWYTDHGTPEHAEKRPGYDPSLPWISSDPDPSSEAWKTAANVRRALSIAIDRQTIVDTLLQGEGEPLVLWAWDSQAHRLPAEIQQWEFNPEKAIQLLADAGYPDGFEVTLTPDIRGVPAEVEATEAIATMWEDIGVRAKLNNVPYATIRPSLATRTYNQINTHGTAGRSDPLDLIATVFRSSGGWTAGMDHPVVEEAIDKALAIVDEEERYKVMVELAEFIYENTLEAGIYTVNIIWPLGPNIDSWFEHLEYGDRRTLSATEFAPHRQ